MSVFEALRKRFDPPAWAYLEEVRNGTGYIRKTTRTADGLAFSLYPSRGLELHGIEVKSHRADWLNELKQPEKAEEIARFCHRWWIATEADVIRDAGEVPPTWGWLTMQGSRLVTKREAPLLQPAPLDLPMLASIFRNVATTFDSAVSARLAARWQEANEKREAEEKTSLERDQKRLDDQLAEYERARNLLWAIERAAGVRLRESEGIAAQVWLAELPPEVLAKFEALNTGELDNLRASAERIVNQLRDVSTRARRLMGQAGVRSTLTEWERKSRARRQQA